MTTKTELFNRTTDYIYAPKLEDLNIFSKEYFNYILKPYYSSNDEHSNYGVIYIDYNKLNDINNTYGFETGDKIIHYSLLLMQSVLPNDCISSRIGGDEFAFLLPSCNHDKIDFYINSIYDILQQHEKELLFCNVTAYGVHSSEKDTLSEMIDEADTNVTEKKNNCNQFTSHSKWGILEKKLERNLISFFKSLRLFNQPISNEFLKTLYLQAISSCSDLLEKDFEKPQKLSEDKVTTPIFTEEELNKLYSIFLKESPNAEEIDNIDEETYTLFMDKLIHDPITNKFSRQYLEKHLLRDSNQTFKIKYFSTSFVKLYNTIFSHSDTDEKITEIINNLLAYLQNKQNIDFSDETFSDKPQNYFIALGAGDYILAMPEDNFESINNEEINNYLDSTVKDKPQLEDILNLFYSKNFETLNSENCGTVLTALSNECKSSKDIHKLSILDEPSIKDALNTIIYDSAQYYISNIPRCDSINNKNRFLQLIVKTMLSISVDLNKEQEKNEEK